MKKTYLTFLKTFRLALVFVTTQFVFNAYAKAQIRDKPHMWVAKANGIATRDNFRTGILNPSGKSKFDLLSATLGQGQKETQSILYSLKSFQTLISTIDDPAVAYLRVYIAAYDKNYGGQYVPSGFDQHLTIIFAPVNQTGADIGIFYIVKADGTITNLPPTIKDKWIQKYLDVKMPELIKTIDGTLPENKYGGQPSDTRNILYYWSYFKEMALNEVAYQQDPSGYNIPISGIQIDFASTINGYAQSIQQKNRLLLQFEFLRINNMTGQSEVFYIDDDTTIFPQRATAPSEIPPPTGWPLRAFDTGNLCPPSCN